MNDHDGAVGHIILALDALRGLPPTRERALATTKLHEAGQWLGKTLPELEGNRR